MYFYHLLKPIADQELVEEEFIDWGHEQAYEQAIGVGECAGIMLDVVTTIIGEADEKLKYAVEELERIQFADAIYNSYNAFVIGAKALLLSRDIQCNTQAGIINDFSVKIVEPGLFPMEGDFAEQVYLINKHEPGRDFAMEYFKKASLFIENVKKFRDVQRERSSLSEDKTVISNHYKA